MAELAASESTFVERPIFDDAEHAFQEHLAALKRGTESVYHPRALNDHQHPHPAHHGHFQGRHPVPHHPAHHPQHHNYHPHPSHSNQSHQHFQPRHPHHRHPAPHHHPPQHGSGAKTSIAGEIAKAREQIKHTLHGLDGEGADKFDEMMKDYIEIKKKLSELEKIVGELSKKVESLDKLNLAAPSTISSSEPVVPAKAAAAWKSNAAAAEEEDEDDDDFELFESDKGVVDDDYERVKQERVKAYEEKKSKKPQLIAKSNIILSVKPWDDEIDMSKIEKCVRSIEMDGLLWGASKLVPVAYGIKALQISCVVEDDKVSTEELEEKIVAFEDYKITEHKLSVDPPVLTEEESKSRFIPENFRCDACKAVAFQFYTAFDDFNKYNKQHKYNIPEYELLDLVDKICDPSTYKLYGIKEIKGLKKLSGGGLPSRDVPVVMSGGGMWPGR
ncbi:hypothetical protein HELRODRAFT_194214 [Helobdella robusta]|uniref:Translation elongation factor EF1B beta/delta subunit guanine nucleotide exchange domain-containing protein n=1 Tax=Helobdella robusta TaxID=6412 RepID=T1FVT4_HELRO|nr:hypothetical protein HELRODRAFT_194214 [Helobdella robusta]ESN92496.1 hypothetical protein HELRODRAFT_194214 [Helobdella robusta]